MEKGDIVQEHGKSSHSVASWKSRHSAAVWKKLSKRSSVVKVVIVDHHGKVHKA